MKDHSRFDEQLTSECITTLRSLSIEIDSIMQCNCQQWQLDWLERQHQTVMSMLRRFRAVESIATEQDLRIIEDFCDQVVEMDDLISQQE